MIEINKEKRRYFNISVSRDELLAIAAFSGYVGGSHPIRLVFTRMGIEAAEILGLPDGDVWEEAEKESGISISGSILVSKGDEE
jgi:hypothetical protein